MKYNKGNLMVVKMTYMFIALLLVGCTEVPDPGSIAPDVRYKNRKQYAVSGLAQQIGEFQSSTSTLPLQFHVVNLWETTGKSVDAFTDSIDVIQYKEAITGNESEEELLFKTEKVKKPAVSINPFTGKVEILEGNQIPAGEYHFDIQVTNTSGATVLKDALVIEFEEFQVTQWSTGMKKEPVIERIGDTPHQILFVGHVNNVPLHGDQIDFTANRSLGFKGTFVSDTPEGERWKVNFPLKQSDTYCTWKMPKGESGEFEYVTENFNFVLGRSGNYVIKLYK